MHFFFLNYEHILSWTVQKMQVSDADKITHGDKTGTKWSWQVDWRPLDLLKCITFHTHAIFLKTVKINLFLNQTITAWMTSNLKFFFLKLNLKTFYELLVIKVFFYEDKHKSFPRVIYLSTIKIKTLNSLLDILCKLSKF